MTNFQLLKPQLFNLLLTTFLRTWDKNINKPEIKTFAYLSIIFHNLQIIFFLPLALIYANLQFGYPNCVHPYNIKIAVEWSLKSNSYIPSLMFFLFCMAVENCLPALFYIHHLWVHCWAQLYTHHFMKCSFCSMTFYYKRKLPSKVPSVRR